MNTRQTSELNGLPESLLTKIRARENKIYFAGVRQGITTALSVATEQLKVSCDELLQQIERERERDRQMEREHNEHKTDK